MRTKMLFFLLLMLVAAGVGAQNHPPGMRGRAFHQRARIAEGRRSGDITHREARRLHGQQRRIQHGKPFARRDGFLSPRERKHLQMRQHHASKNIRRKKHNFRRVQ